jgi:hypothetical protein
MTVTEGPERLNTHTVPPAPSLRSWAAVPVATDSRSATSELALSPQEERTPAPHRVRRRRRSVGIRLSPATELRDLPSMTGPPD